MRFHLPTSVMVMVLLLASASADLAIASPQVGGTANWTIVGVPRFTTIGISPTVETMFQNNLDVAVLGIVVMVVHNNLGQTIFYSTATLNLTRGFSGTAYTVEFGLSPGIYKATIFAFSTSGIAISNSTTISFSA